MGEGRGVHRVLVGKPEGKRPLGRPRPKWEENIRWIFGKWEGWRLNRVGSGLGQMVGTCEWGDELSGSINCGEFLD